jgi:citrate lyase subunit beta/citryl-CoA lyase
MHPAQALFPGGEAPAVVPSCDHYAGTERLMGKALQLQAESPHAFDVTLDLEDGAPTGRERDHADLVVELLRSDANARGRVGARIHDVTSPHWKADIDALVRGAGDRLSHLTIPKVPAARPAVEMVTYLQKACAAAGVKREIPVHILIETHGALAECRQIAGLPWLRGLDFGIMDYVSAHHGAIPASAMRSPGQFEHALVRHAKTVQCVTALSHGLVPAHSVTLALRDVEQVRADASRARREFGYLRMWSIHPAQIEPICQAFAASDDELELAGRVLLAGSAAAWAPVDVDDTLYDRASYRYFWRALARAEQDGAQLADEVRVRFFSEGA